MKVFFFALFLGWFNASSAVAQISCDVLINGKVSFTLSKSETNVFTLNGTGCDSFELKALNGVELKKIQGGYEVSRIYGNMAYLRIIGHIGKKAAVISCMNLKIVD